MHNPETALRSLNFMQHNFRLVADKVDLDCMENDKAIKLIKRKVDLMPYRVSTFFARTGAFISVWTGWEFYAKCLLNQIHYTVKKKQKQSFPLHVKNGLLKNGSGVQFQDYEWFDNANQVRNCIVHDGGKVIKKKSNSFKKAQKAFSDPELDIYLDQYLALEFEHVSEVFWKAEEFVQQTASLFKH